MTRRPGKARETGASDTGDNRPVFSVVVPLHNKSTFIDRCLRSVLEQSFGAYEIIVVDDASTDGGAERVQRCDDPRLTLLRRDRPGPGGYAARNLAIGRARGDWIAFLDADDRWHADHLAEVHATIASRGPDIGCVFSGYQMVWPDRPVEADGYSSSRRTSTRQVLDLSDFLTAWVDLGDCPMLTSAIAIKRDVLISMDGFPEGRCRRGGDKDMWLRVMARTKAARQPRSTVVYHKDATNMVTNLESTSVSHCIEKTVIEMLSDGRFSDHRRLLRQVLNTEIFSYARISARARRPRMGALRSFSVSDNPGLFVTALAMCLMPPGSARAVNRALRSCRRMVAR